VRPRGEPPREPPCGSPPLAGRPAPSTSRPTSARPRRPPAPARIAAGHLGRLMTPASVEACVSRQPAWTPVSRPQQTCLAAWPPLALPHLSGASRAGGEAQAPRLAFSDGPTVGTACGMWWASWPREPARRAPNPCVAPSNAPIAAARADSPDEPGRGSKPQAPAHAAAHSPAFRRSPRPSAATRLRDARLRAWRSRASAPALQR
jgi:hypothetical protein